MMLKKCWRRMTYTQLELLLSGKLMRDELELEVNFLQHLKARAVIVPFFINVKDNSK
jgi:hypothetical protein